MWYPPVVTAAADEEPVTVADAKTWGRFEDSADDDRVESALLASREWVEKFTGTWLMEQTVTVKCDSFCDFEHLPLAPVQSVAITYLDTDGASQTLAGSVYELRADGLETSIVLKYGQTWPSFRLGSRISVVAVCGYTDVPPSILQAIKLRTIAECDGPISDETNAAIEALLANHRRFI